MEKKRSCEIVTLLKKACYNYAALLKRSIREKCPNMEFFLVRFFLVRIQEKTDQKKLRIWTIFTQWVAAMEGTVF